MNTALGFFILWICIKDFVMGSDCTQFGKASVNCYGRMIKEVPQDLPKSSEIMGLANNKIRKLKVYSFQRYTKLRVLELYDNSIFFIEEATFEPLSDLEKLDLSTNALRTLPLDLFNLPSLRTLFLDSNPLTDLKQHLTRLEKPISAPLEVLNVADCQLDDIPNLGILPKLLHLNASNNQLDKISFEIFPMMCALESIDFTKNNIPFCECQEIAEIASLYYPKTLADRLNFCDNSGKNQRMCPDPTLEDTMRKSPEYQKCIYTVSHPPISKKTWVIIGVCLAVIIIIVLTLIYQIRKRRQKKRLKKKKMANKAEHLFMYKHNNNGSTSQEAELDRNELTSSPS